MKRLDIKGKKFGRLVVISYSGTSKDGRTQWNCECECGANTVAQGKLLVSGHIKSCGCLRKDTIKSISTKHGLACTRTYKIWAGMIQRCTNDKVECFSRYGAAGISVCDRWVKSFESFIEDMWAAPDGYQIDRIDNKKGYNKDNCKWSTLKEQARNKKNNRLIEINGKVMCVAAWAEEYGIEPDLIHGRLKRNWVGESLLLNPIKNRDRMLEKTYKSNFSFIQAGA